MTTMSHDPANPPRRWPWFIVGAVLFFLGPVLTFVQFNVLGRLTTPWQLPVLATLGVICMLLSVLQTGGALRTGGFLVFAFISGFEWFMFLVSMNTPLYAGSANPGSPLPAFAAKLADGQPIAHTNLADGKSSVLVFYRGHW